MRKRMLMKQPYFPFSVLLVLTIAVTGFAVLYNFVLEPQHATTLQYIYPVVEQASEPSASPDSVRVYAGGGMQNTQTMQQDEPNVQFPLNLNTATAEELKAVPRVGDVLSQRIVQYRDVLGGYTDLRQLMEIKGIGESTYAEISAYLYIA